jgi:cell division protein FtsN
MPSLPVPKPDLPVIVEAVPGPDAKKPDLPQMSVVSVPEPELRSSPQPWPEMPPVHIIIYNYVVNPPPPDTPAFQFSEQPVPEPPVPQFCEPPPVFPPMASRYPPLYDTPPASEVLIIPGLPSPNSYRLYHLQVGAYPNAEKASRALRQLQAAGFDAFQEMASADVYRVFAVGIPAAIVYDAVRRLGAMGFSQVWVWE